MITTETFVPIQTITDLIDAGILVNNKLAGTLTVLDKYALGINFNER
jgi:hypothetical protein